MKEALKESIKQITNKYAGLLEANICSILEDSNAVECHGTKNLPKTSQDGFKRNIRHFSLPNYDVSSGNAGITKRIKDAAEEAKEAFKKEIAMLTGISEEERDKVMNLPLYTHYSSASNLRSLNSAWVILDEWVVYFHDGIVTFVLSDCLDLDEPIIRHDEVTTSVLSDLYVNKEKAK